MDFIEQNITTYGALYDALAKGAVLLTVNNRLAARFSLDYNGHMAEKGASVWPTPQILPISSWLEAQIQLFETQTQNPPRFLTAEQEKLLWTNLLQPDAYQVYMMPAASIARPVMQAWQLIKQWQVPLSALETFETPETQSFLNWSKKFEDTCKKHNWLSLTQSYAYVSDVLSDEKIRLPEQIIVAGFEDPNQSHQTFFRQLQQLCQLSEFQLTGHSSQPVVFSCNDFDEEIRAAAHWARQQLLEKSDQNHLPKLAVVIPSLQENRAKVERCFNQVLHPERFGPPPHQHHSLFNLSLGKPLADYALIDQAIRSLKLLSPVIDSKELLNLLQAPYLFGPAQLEKQTLAPLSFSQRSLIDRDLRIAGRLRWTLKALLHQAKSKSSADCPTNSQTKWQTNWQTRLTLLQNWQAMTSKKRTPQEWVEVFFGVWKALGWPGEHSLDSDEYQQSERLQKLLADLAKLHPVQPLMRYADAVSQFTRLCGDTVFQPQSESAPILVAGLLEAADQPYDAIWVSGLDDQTLPAQTAPNPFIPVAIQKQFNLPHSSTDREFQFAQKLLSQFCRLSDQIIFSYAEKEGDSERRPSPLLDQYEINDLGNIAGTSKASRKQEGEQVKLEAVTIQPLAALPEHSTVKGGTRVLDLETQCPFRANAEIRLKAQQPDDLCEGTPAMLWGSQIHSVLEACWKQIKSLQQLKSMDEQSLTDLISQQVDIVLAEARLERPDLYRPNYLALEKQRMQSIVYKWFELEIARPMDFEIAALEQQQLITIGKIQLKTRIDRIDQLANGQKILLDYKTGLSSSSKAWTTEQIAEPQLPLYSLALRNELAALAFAKVHEKQCSFDGLAHQDDILPGIDALRLSADDDPGGKPGDKNEALTDNNPDWLPLQTHWQQSLSELAEAYRLGNNRIDNSNCMYCDKAAFCRHFENQLENQLEKRPGTESKAQGVTS